VIAKGVVRHDRWLTMRSIAFAFAVSMALLAGCARPAPEPDPEIKASVDLFFEVWEETNDPFEARRQAKTKHLGLFISSPVLSRNLDALTALAWTSQGGEWAGAECYMRGFQFGTAHHDQCVYEVKMYEGRGGSGNRRAGKHSYRTFSSSTMSSNKSISSINSVSRGNSVSTSRFRSWAPDAQRRQGRL
jgi:hypothetical protein